MKRMVRSCFRQINSLYFNDFFQLWYQFYMRASLYRRNYYLSKINDEHLQQQQNKEKEIYEQSVRIINDMINQIKTLLLKCNIFKNQIEHAENIDNFQYKVTKFKLHEKTIPFSFNSRFPLDVKMAGLFVLHVCKQMAYWNMNLPFLNTTIEEVNHSFELQKSSEINIPLLYNICIKDILQRTAELERQIRSHFQQSSESKSSDNDVQSDILLVPCFNIYATDSAVVKTVKIQLEEDMRRLLHVQYRGLQIEQMEAVKRYIGELLQKQNLDLLFKKQLKRNKRMKKEIKQYRTVYQEYIQKKERERKRKDLKNRTNIHTTSVVQLNYKQPAKNLTSLNHSEGKQAKYTKVSFPRVPSAQFNDLETRKHSKTTKNKSAGKENRQNELKPSISDMKPISNQLKIRRNELKLKLKL